MVSRSSEKALAGQKIGFFGRGGAGKSTAVVLIGRALAKAGYTAVILDADSTNVGLHQALGIHQPPAPLLDYFGGTIFEGGMVTCPVNNPTPLDGADIQLDVLPRDYYRHAARRVYLLSGGKLGDSGAGSGCDGPISKIARDIRVRANSQPVVTLVDFKAGFEDTARGVVTGMDWVTVVVDPSQASLALANHMKQTVESIHSGHLPATKHLGNHALVELANQLFEESPLQGASFVLSKIPNEKTESYLRRRLADDGIFPIGVIRDTPRVREAWLTGGVIDDAQARRDAELIVLELEKVVMEFTASV